MFRVYCYISEEIQSFLRIAGINFVFIDVSGFTNCEFYDVLLFSEMMACTLLWIFTCSVLYRSIDSSSLHRECDTAIV